MKCFQILLSISTCAATTWQDARDAKRDAELEAAIVVLGEGQGALRGRSDKTEQEVADIFAAVQAGGHRDEALAARAYTRPLFSST